MFNLYITDTFSAAHQIKEYNGKCESLHGHNFKVEAIFQGDILGPGGMLIDFKILKMLLKKVLETLDHKYLNEIDFFQKRSCSSEYIALYIFVELKKLIQDYNVTLREVRVWESETAYASYTE